jgi:hypothetical protein
MGGKRLEAGCHHQQQNEGDRPRRKQETSVQIIERGKLGHGNQLPTVAMQYDVLNGIIGKTRSI